MTRSSSDNVEEGQYLSPLLAGALARSGLMDLQEYLCGPVGVRTASCLAALTDEELQRAASMMYLVGFGPGHVRGLYLLRWELAATLPALAVAGPATLHDSIAGAQSDLRGSEAEFAAWGVTSSDAQAVNSATAARLQAEAREASRAMEGVAQLAEARGLIERIAAAAGVEDVAQPSTNALAARALLSIDALIRIGGDNAPSKRVQKAATDILTLACARPLPQADLEKQGIPTAMRESLSAAVGFDITQDGGLYSRLGTSKYNLFTRGVKFSTRRAARPRPQSAVDGPGEPEVVTPSRAVSTETAHGLPLHLPPRSPTPDFGDPEERDAREPAVLASATGLTGRSCEDIDHFLLSQESSDGFPSLAVLLPGAASEVAVCRRAASVASCGRDEDARSLVCSSVAATSRHGEWGLAKSNLEQKARAIRACAGRAEIEEELQEIRHEREADDLWMPTIGEPAKQVMEELQRRMPNMKFKSIVRAWVELVGNQRAPELQLDRYELRGLLAAVEQVLLASDDAVDVLLHGCEALGALANADPELAEDIAPVVVGLMHRQSQNIEVQKVGLEALWRLCSSRQMVLSLTSSSQAPALTSAVRAQILMAIQNLWERESNGPLKELATQVLVRIQPLPDVLKLLGFDATLLTAALSEVFSALRGQLEWYWSDSDTPHEDVAAKERDRDLILRLAQQMSSEQVDGSSQNLLRVVANWVKEGRPQDYNVSYWARHRMILAGVLFDAGGLVVRMLSGMLGDGRGDCYVLDKDTPLALRALIELVSLGILDSQLARQVIQQVHANSVLLATQFPGAYVGTLAVFAQVVDPSLANSFVLETVNIANCWVHWLPVNSGAIHEALWALNKIFQIVEELQRERWAAPCLALCDCLESNRWLVKTREEEGVSSSDAISILREVPKLRALFLRPPSVCAAAA